MFRWLRKFRGLPAFAAAEAVLGGILFLRYYPESASFRTRVSEALEQTLGARVRVEQSRSSWQLRTTLEGVTVEFDDDATADSKATPTVQGLRELRVGKAVLSGDFPEFRLEHLRLSEVSLRGGRLRDVVRDVRQLLAGGSGDWAPLFVAPRLRVEVDRVSVGITDAAAPDRALSHALSKARFVYDRKQRAVTELDAEPIEGNLIGGLTVRGSTAPGDELILKANRLDFAGILANAVDPPAFEVPIGERRYRLRPEPKHGRLDNLSIRARWGHSLAAPPIDLEATAEVREADLDLVVDTLPVADAAGPTSTHRILFRDFERRLIYRYSEGLSRLSVRPTGDPETPVDFEFRNLKGSILSMISDISYQAGLPAPRPEVDLKMRLLLRERPPVTIRAEYRPRLGTWRTNLEGPVSKAFLQDIAEAAGSRRFSWLRDVKDASVEYLLHDSERSYRPRYRFEARLVDETDLRINWWPRPSHSSVPDSPDGSKPSKIEKNETRPPDVQGNFEAVISSFALIPGRLVFPKIQTTGVLTMRNTGNGLFVDLDGRLDPLVILDRTNYMDFTGENTQLTLQAEIGLGEPLEIWATQLAARGESGWTIGIPHNKTIRRYARPEAEGGARPWWDVELFVRNMPMSIIRAKAPLGNEARGSIHVILFGDETDLSYRNYLDLEHAVIDRPAIRLSIQNLHIERFAGQERRYGGPTEDERASGTERKGAEKAP